MFGQVKSQYGNQSHQLYRACISVKVNALLQNHSSSISQLWKAEFHPLLKLIHHILQLSSQVRALNHFVLSVLVANVEGNTAQLM